MSDNQPFTMVPNWILWSESSGLARLLYTLLLHRVNRKRGDGVAYPSMELLAKEMGFQRRHSVLPYMRELIALGAVEVTTKGRRNVYTVRETPPPGYTGAMSQREHDDRMRARGDTAPSPTPGDMDALATTDMDATASIDMDAPASTNKTKKNKTKRTTTDSPPARPPADAWRDDKAWMSYKNEDIEGDLLDFVEKRFGYGAFVGQPVVDAILCRGEPLPKVLNTAVKIAREWSA